MHAFVIALGLMATGGHVAFGQLLENSNSVSVYRHADRGVPTMTVSVWGAVRTTGQYEVEQGIDLLELLTIAGGPQLSVQQDGNDRRLTLKISRGTPGQRTVVYSARLQDLASERQTYPEVLDGDIILLEERIVRSRFRWSDALRLVTTAGTLTILALRIIDKTP